MYEKKRLSRGKDQNKDFLKKMRLLPTNQKKECRTRGKIGIKKEGGDRWGKEKDNYWRGLTENRRRGPREQWQGTNYTSSVKKTKKKQKFIGFHKIQHQPTTSDNTETKTNFPFTLKS